jgi:hypothetical protein
MWVLLAILVAIIVLFFAITPKRKVATREEAMTMMNMETASSYQQKTNHLPMTDVNMGPISGFESQYRVNLHQAYIT